VIVARVSSAAASDRCSSVRMAGGAEPQRCGGHGRLLVLRQSLCYAVGQPAPAPVAEPSDPDPAGPCAATHDPGLTGWSPRPHAWVDLYARAVAAGPSAAKRRSYLKSMRRRDLELRQLAHPRLVHPLDETTAPGAAEHVAGLLHVGHGDLAAPSTLSTTIRPISLTRPSWMENPCRAPTCSVGQHLDRLQPRGVHRRRALRLPCAALTEWSRTSPSAVKVRSTSADRPGEVTRGREAVGRGPDDDGVDL